MTVDVDPSTQPMPDLFWAAADLSGSVISWDLPNGSNVRGCLSCRKTASCDLMDSP